MEEGGSWKTSRYRLFRRLSRTVPKRTTVTAVLGQFTAAFRLLFFYYVLVLHQLAKLPIRWGRPKSKLNVYGKTSP